MKDHRIAIWRSSDGDVMLAGTLVTDEEHARKVLGDGFIGFVPGIVIQCESKTERDQKTDWREDRRRASR